jgi:hypothetical protein
MRMSADADLIKIKRRKLSQIVKEQRCRHYPYSYF